MYIKFGNRSKNHQTVKLKLPPNIPHIRYKNKLPYALCDTEFVNIITNTNNMGISTTLIDDLIT